MTTQDTIFLESEANQWFQRNREAIIRPDKVDWPTHVVSLLEYRGRIESVLELGCSNGYRLAKLGAMLPSVKKIVGVEPSVEAIEDGKKRFPAVQFHQGMLSDIPLQDSFDLVIVNFVLHWVDRSTLARSVAQIDRMVREGGTLVLGDFLPDHPQRRNYHHIEGKKVYTYKQDYAKIFEALGIYREFCRVSFDHGSHAMAVSPGESSSRGVCVALKKEINAFYPEVV